MPIYRKLLLAAALAGAVAPGVVCAADAVAPAAPAAQEITAVTVFGRLPRRPSETVRRLDSSAASSCAFFRSGGHADDMIDNYLDHFHGRGRNPENSATPILDAEGNLVTNVESFRDTAPDGDASNPAGRGAVLGDAESADKCGRSDRYSAAGRNYLQRKDKSMNQAYEAYDKGDYATALTRFKEAYSKLGTDEAALMLGNMYLYGQGGAADVKEAIAWYTRLANSRRTNQQFSRYNPAEPEAATPKVEAQLRLARIYRAGYQVAPDAAKARALYQDAVDLNHIPANVALAGMLLAGAGGDKDPAKAAALLNTAAEHGYAPAQWVLARLYQDGAGVPQDMAKAFSWYQQAAFNPRPDGKKPYAQFALAQMYDTGKGTAADPARALAFYKLAAVAGHPDAQSALGTYFYEGQLVAKDPAVARKLFIAAAIQGQPDGMVNAAAMLFKGEGGTQDLAQAYVWLRLADKLGHARAAAMASALEPRLSAEQRARAAAILAPPKSKPAR